MFKGHLSEYLCYFQNKLLTGDLTLSLFYVLTIMSSLSTSCEIIVMPGAYYSGVLYPFVGAFFMFLMGSSLEY